MCTLAGDSQFEGAAEEIQHGVPEMHPEFLKSCPAGLRIIRCALPDGMTRGATGPGQIRLSLSWCSG